MIPFEKIKKSPLVKQFIENRFDNKNVLVYAEGGFGKTTAMRCLQVYLLDLAQKEKIVPLYIDVKKFDQFSNKPLIHYIYTEYSGSDTKESDVENLFTDQAPSTQYKYKYFILIDGYNEVPVSARFNINSEISNFVQKENVRIILSSRLNEQVDIFKGFKRISLLGLNNAQIKLYLKKHFDMDFDLEKVNQSLVNILRSPLYMSAFSKTYGRKKPFPELFSEKEVRKGDILDNFIFHSLDKLRPNESINDLLAEFILLYFMPALAFRMYKNESFTITKKEMERLVDDVDYFKSLLDIEKQGKYLGEYSRNIYDIEKICCDNIAVLQRTSYGYEMHNIYRDFFAAKHIINCMNAGKLDELETPVSENVRQFAGELIREHKDGCGYSKDYMDKSDEEKFRKSECDFEEKDNLEVFSASPVEDFLQKHNLKTQCPLSAIATKNLIEIMKTSRNGNITAKYDDLDLKYVFFYKVNMQKSTFNGTKLYSYNFIPPGHIVAVNSVSFSPDGTKIVSGSDDNTIRIWDVKTGLQIGKPLTGHASFVNSVSFSPDGTKIVSGSNDNTIRIWDAQTGAQIGEPLAGHKDSVNSISFSSDGTKIVSGSNDGTIRIWDAQTGLQIGAPFVGHIGPVNSVAFSPDGTKIVSAGRDRTIRIWNAKTGAQIGEPLTVYVISVAFSPDGTKIVSAGWDRTIRIWNAQTGAQIGELLTGHTLHVISVAFSPDGTKIVSGSADETIRIWDAKTGIQQGKSLTGHTEFVNSVAFSPDGTKIVSGGDDATICIWDVETGTQIGEPITGRTNYVNSASFSPDSTKIVSGGFDGTIRIWDAETGVQIGKPFTGHTSRVTSVSFSPDGTKIVSASWDRTIRIWDAETGSQMGKLFNGSNGHMGHLDRVNSVAFSPDGTKIVSGSGDVIIRIWDVETDLQIGEPLIGHTSSVNSVSFSPNGKRMVSCGSYFDETIRIWDAETGVQIGKPLTGHTNSVDSVSFSPDGEKIVSGSDDKTIRIWDAQTGAQIGEPLTGHTSFVNSVSFSPDGQKIVSGSADNTIRIWDTKTGEQIGGSLVGHTGWVTSVSFSPDGKKIVSGSHDGTIRIWNLEDHLCAICKIMSSCIINCDFRNANYKNNDKSEFYGMIYSNGGIVKDEFVPKPVPFEFSDETKRKEEKYD